MPLDVPKHVNAGPYTNTFRLSPNADAVGVPAEEKVSQASSTSPSAPSHYTSGWSTPKHAGSFSQTTGESSRHDFAASNYNTRVNTVGYGGTQSSSLLQRTWSIPQENQDRIVSLVKGNGNAQLVQQIQQGFMPHDDACAGMAAEWIKLHVDHKGKPSREISMRFGDALNNSFENIINRQNLHTSMKDAFARLAKDPSRAGVKDEPFKKALIQLLMARGGGALPTALPSTEALIPGDAVASADKILKHIENDGVYYLGLNGEAEGHAMAIKVSNAEGQFKLMDPNTGEFLATNINEFRILLARNILGMNYSTTYEKFTVIGYN